MQKLLVLVLLIVMWCSGCGAEPSVPRTTFQPPDGVEKQLPALPVPADSPGEWADNQADSGSAHQQERGSIFLPRGVKLVRPVGFEDAEAFHGFQQPSTQSSVMVVMIPGPFAEVTRGFTGEERFRPDLDPRQFTFQLGDQRVEDETRAYLTRLGVTETE